MNTFYEYDIEDRMTRVWASVPEQNSSQAAGPFGGSKDVALVKTIEYYRGTAMPSGSGQTITWAGIQITSGSYVSAVRTFTYKDANGNYDMVYTSNARGQAEKTHFIDSDNSTTRISTRHYTWRDRVRRATNPDGNSVDFEYDDHLWLTKEKLQGDNEYYQYEYCLCGPVKRHKYHYIDSLSNAQDMEWVNTVDKLGRMKKEYYPYAIGKHGSDEYHSILYEHDRANRRELMSNPVWGHVCADTSGWTNHIEDQDEDNWIFDEPQVYRYGAQGNLEATGCVKGREIMAGAGEPYFIQRDNLGRSSSVTYPDLTSSGRPQGNARSEYGPDGRLKETAFVSAMQAGSGIYGPEQYVVQFQYDNSGRMVRRVVRENTVSDATRFEETFEYDGRGQTVREKIMAWHGTNERMVVKQDIKTTYDLGGNPTEVKFYDNLGLAYTETRTYARGYQLTGASFSDLGTNVTVSTSGSYTYDTNNNLTGTKKVDARRSATQLSFRAQWTFTYDRKNRMKTHTNTGALNVRGNLWYDGLGRVWQRWNDTLGTFAATLTRNVYDGSQLIQEHTFEAEANGTWVYTYSDISRDYLRQPGGLRERQRISGTDYDYFMQGDSGRLDYQAKRGDLATMKVQVDRTRSLNQLSGGTFNDLSHLATSGQFIESYGGGTTGSSAGFDPLMVSLGRESHLPGLGRPNPKDRKDADGKGPGPLLPSSVPEGGSAIGSDLTGFSARDGVSVGPSQLLPGNWIPLGKIWQPAGRGLPATGGTLCMILRRCQPHVIYLEPERWPCYSDADRCGYLRPNLYLLYLLICASRYECSFTQICVGRDECNAANVPADMTAKGWEFHDCIENGQCFYRLALSFGDGESGCFMLWDERGIFPIQIGDCYNYYDLSAPGPWRATPLGYQGEAYAEALYQVPDRCNCAVATVGFWRRILEWWMG
jgi:hypothetical protein